VERTASINTSNSLARRQAVLPQKRIRSRCLACRRMLDNTYRKKTRKHCSTRCRWIYNKRMSRFRKTGRLAGIVRCENMDCGKLFRQKRISHRYCCDFCRWRDYFVISSDYHPRKKAA